MICATPNELPAIYRSKPLFSGGYACVYDEAQREGRGPISEAEFRDAVHLRVSYGAQRGFIDDLLESTGVQRRVPLSLSHFAGIATVLRANPAIVTLPDYAARALARAGGLAVSPVPLNTPKFTVSAIWQVAGGDSGQAWLLSLLDDYEEAAAR